MTDDPPRLRMCEWAGCDKPAAKHVDGYWHCRGCLLIHYRQTGQTHDLDIAERLQQVPALVEAGLTDQQIAEALNVSHHRAREARRALGIHRPKGPAPEDRHGTLIGYKRHRRQGTPLCGPCRAARAQVDAVNHQKRKARRAANTEEGAA